MESFRLEFVFRLFLIFVSFLRNFEDFFQFYVISLLLLPFYVISLISLSFSLVLRFVHYFDVFSQISLHISVVL